MYAVMFSGQFTVDHSVLFPADRSLVYPFVKKTGALLMLTFHNSERNKECMCEGKRKRGIYDI